MQVYSFERRALQLTSLSEVTLNTPDAQLSLKNRKALINANQLDVQAIVFENNGTGVSSTLKNVLSVSHDRLTVSSQETRLNSASGVVVKGTLQTNRIESVSSSPSSGSSDSSHGLVLESVAESMLVSAGKDITFGSTVGSIDIAALDGVTLSAEEGSIILSAASLNFLFTDPSGSLPANGVFQLCVCDNSGKLYRVPGNMLCNSVVTAC